MSKDFREELEKFHNLLLKREPFSFGRFADGEWAAMNNQELNNGEFQNNSSVPQKLRDELWNAFKYRHKDYYVFLSCPCCDNIWKDMRQSCGQDEDHMSFSNLFVNSNHQLFLDTFVKSFKDFDVQLVCHKSSRIENLPFLPEKVRFIERNAWVENYDLIKRIQDENLSGKLLLFSAGPFANLLSHQLFESNKNNIYMDIGSSLNGFLESGGFYRDFLNSSSIYAQRKCVW